MCKIGTPTTIRDKYFKKIFEFVSDSAAAGVPIAGTNFWGWGGEGRGINEDNVWRQGDPLQAIRRRNRRVLNSVFDADTSTIQIF